MTTTMPEVGARCAICQGANLAPGRRYEAGRDDPIDVALCPACWFESPPYYARRASRTAYYGDRWRPEAGA